jgi:hypothetical protein
MSEERTLGIEDGTTPNHKYLGVNSHYMSIIITLRVSRVEESGSDGSHSEIVEIPMRCTRAYYNFTKSQLRITKV